MSEKPFKKTLVLDFDGVIHSYTSPWTSAIDIIDPPVDKAIPALIEYAKHFDVKIYSSRSNEEGGIQAMQEWLVDWLRKYEDLPAGFDIEYFVVYTIGWPVAKPPAFLTLDDRAKQFTGVWPTVEDIKNFRPWNK